VVLVRLVNYDDEFYTIKAKYCKYNYSAAQTVKTLGLPLTHSSLFFLSIWSFLLGVDLFPKIEKNT
jgi:hypothetical protein